MRVLRFSKNFIPSCLVFGLAFGAVASIANATTILPLHVLSYLTGGEVGWALAGVLGGAVSPKRRWGAVAGAVTLFGASVGYYFTDAIRGVYGSFPSGVEWGQVQGDLEWFVPFSTGAGLAFGILGGCARHRDVLGALAAAVLPLYVVATGLNGFPPPVGTSGSGSPDTAARVMGVLLAWGALVAGVSFLALALVRAVRRRPTDGSAPQRRTSRVADLT